MTLRMLPAGDRALLIEYPDLDATLRHFAALSQTELAGVDELVPAASTILVRYRPEQVDAATLAGRIRALPPGDGRDTDLEPVTLDVVYVGDDLEEVAGLLEVSTDELIRRHTEATWSGAFAGFAPGFVYCVGDDPLFSTPRRSSPRTRIPAGSVALAGEFSAVYPAESPGGWQLIGRTPEPMWDLTRTPPAAIQPGQQVRYRAVRETVDFSHLEAATPSLPPVADTARRLEIVRPGAQLLLQDLGRPGLLGMGVAASGAADRRALRTANRVVGNASGEAALELAGGGSELLAHADCVVAYTGAEGERSITTATGETHAFERGVPVAVDAGDRLRIGGFTQGLRGYLAVRGGFALDPVLGSLATDTLAGVGPAPLRAGDALELADHRLARPVEPGELPDALPAGPHDTVALRVALGPRSDWFTDEAVTSLAEQEWTVTPQSDRVGVRLEGATPLERRIHDELPSEGAVTGSIQVPPNGQPVLFLPDHPLTGGYPIIGAVIDADLDRAAQLAPGMRLRFRIEQPFHER